TVLDFPECAGCRIDREPLRIAVAVTPDFRPGVGAAEKRVAIRRRSVRRDPDQFAQMIAEILRLVAVGEMLAQRDEQIAVVGLHDAAAVMISRRERPVLAEDDSGVVEAAIGVVQFCAGDRRASAAARSLRKTEIDRLVLRIGFVDRDVEETALAGYPDVGNAPERWRKLSLRRDKAHAA